MKRAIGITFKEYTTNYRCVTLESSSIAQYINNTRHSIINIENIEVYFNHKKK